jgi:hypothetical protein
MPPVRHRHFFASGRTPKNLALFEAFGDGSCRVIRTRKVSGCAAVCHKSILFARNDAIPRGPFSINASTSEDIPTL